MNLTFFLSNQMVYSLQHKNFHQGCDLRFAQIVSLKE